MISKQKWTVCFLILSVPLSRRDSRLLFGLVLKDQRLCNTEQRWGNINSQDVFGYSVPINQKDVRTTQIDVV